MNMLELKLFTVRMTKNYNAPLFEPIGIHQSEAINYIISGQWLLPIVYFEFPINIEPESHVNTLRNLYIAENSH